MYDKQEEYKKAKEKIKEDQSIVFIEDVVSVLPMSHSTFYAYYPDGSDELDNIKELLFQNRVSEKRDIRSNMKDGSASDHIALYKLIGTQEDRAILNDRGENNNSEVDLTDLADAIRGNYTKKEVDET